MATTNKTHEKKIYKLYTEKGIDKACDYANKHNLPYEHCKACEAKMPSIKHICTICGQATTIDSPEPKRKMSYNPGGIGQF